MKRNQNVLAWSIATGLAGSAGGAAASGFQLLEQSASGLGNAYAGQAASAQDSSTIYFNPAGMTKLPGRNAVGAINVIKPSSEFTNTGSTLAPLQTSLGGNGGDAGEWAFVPNTYLSWQINPQIFIGVGINAPFGLKTEYDPSWVGRFHAIESSMKTVNVNPSVAYKMSDTLSIGAGVNYQRADAKLSNSVNYSAASGGAVGVGVEGIATVKGHDHAWGYNVGLLYELNANTRIGAAYRSAMSYTVDGYVTFTNRPALLAGGLPDGGVSADIKLPASASVSLFHRLDPRWDVLADVSWTKWSSIQELNILRANGTLLATTPLRWDDTWRFSVGANYHHSSAWTWRFGLSYDESPVPDADRTPRIPDQDRTWLAFGAQYRLSKQLAMDVGYAHLFVKDPSMNLCNAAQAAANPAACAGKNNLVGTYENNVNIFSTQVRYAF